MFKTDIAREACEKLLDSQVESREFELYGLACASVEIKSDEVAKQVGKRKGRYISIESDAILRADNEQYQSVSLAIADQLRQMLPKDKAPVLVAGLGNRELTPDSIGSKVIDKILVTRHIFEFMPQAADERLRAVSAIAPGVLGVTGIESADIIISIAKKIGAKAIIVIDALAARASERLFATFQISNAGIEPGAGVGNKRSALTEQTAGIPVIALGVPTVVYASSLVYFAIKNMMQDDKSAEEYAQKISSVAPEMVVTPKEIDTIAKDASQIIADGINFALHNVPSQEIKQFTF